MLVFFPFSLMATLCSKYMKSETQDRKKKITWQKWERRWKGIEWEKTRGEGDFLTQKRWRGRRWRLSGFDFKLQQRNLKGNAAAWKLIAQCFRRSSFTQKPKKWLTALTGTHKVLFIILQLCCKSSYFLRLSVPAVTVRCHTWCTYFKVQWANTAP